MNNPDPIPQFFYELSDEEKILLLRYRLLDDSEKEMYLEKLKSLADEMK